LILEKQKARWSLVLRIFVVAVLFNYPWEVGQSSLYAGMDNVGAMLWHCLPPSLGDGLLVLLIYGVGCVVLQRRDWFFQPGIIGHLLTLSAGLVIGVAIELLAMHLLGRWEYTDRMPRLPLFNVGLVPVAQMLLLPSLIFRVVAAWQRHSVKDGAAFGD
jgi:hypothetical protein